MKVAWKRNLAESRDRNNNGPQNRDHDAASEFYTFYMNFMQESVLYALWFTIHVCETLSG